MKEQEITPAAAVYGFAGWLTCRQRPVTMSSTHDAAIVAELVDAFCKSQGFPDLPEGWHKSLKPYPSETHVR